MSPQEAGHGPWSHCIITQGHCQWDSRGSGTPYATHPSTWGKAAWQPELFAFGGPWRPENKHPESLDLLLLSLLTSQGSGSH